MNVPVSVTHRMFRLETPSKVSKFNVYYNNIPKGNRPMWIYVCSLC